MAKKKPVAVRNEGDIITVVPEVHGSRQTQQILHMTETSSPLPPAEEFQKYELTCPGAADRILAMAEKELAHSHEISIKTIEYGMERDKQQLNTESRNSLLGMIFGLTIGISAFAASVITSLYGHDIPGTLLGVTGVAGLVSVFVTGYRKRKDESKEEESDDDSGE